MTEDPWVPAGEAAKLMGVSKRRVYQLIKNKLVRAERVDGLWAIKLSEVKNRKPLRPWDLKKRSITAKKSKG